MSREKVDYNKVKFNVTSLAVMKDKRSRYNRYFSFETCDVCNNQGVSFEVIKYNGLFDLNMIRQAIPYRSYGEITKYFPNQYNTNRLLAKWNDPFYIIFYTCSEDCNSMLLLQQAGL
jgi:hypothetical protein